MPHPFLYTHMPNNFSFIIVIEIEGRSEILAGRGALLKWPGGNTAPHLICTCTYEFCMRTVTVQVLFIVGRALGCRSVEGSTCASNDQPLTVSTRGIVAQSSTRVCIMSSSRYNYYNLVSPITLY